MRYLPIAAILLLGCVRGGSEEDRPAEGLRHLRASRLQSAFQALEPAVRDTKSPRRREAIDCLHELAVALIAQNTSEANVLLLPAAELFSRVAQVGDLPLDVRRIYLKREAQLRQAWLKRFAGAVESPKQTELVKELYTKLNYYPRLLQIVEDAYRLGPTEELALQRMELARRTHLIENVLPALEEIAKSFPQKLPQAYGIARGVQWYPWDRKALIEAAKRHAQAAGITFDMSPDEKILTAAEKMAGAAGFAPFLDKPLKAVRKLPTGVTLPEQWPPRRPVSNEAEPPPYIQNPPKMIPITDARQFFWDDFLIESTENLRRVAHQPKKFEGNPVLKPDQPWEKKAPRYADTGKDPGGFAAPFSGLVMRDPQSGLFRMWYYIVPAASVAYAASRDGITWEKPLAGAAGNSNVLCSVIDSHSVLVGPDKQFRLYNPRHDHDYGVSSDGIGFQHKKTFFFTDDRSTVAWDQFRQVYVAMLRVYVNSARAVTFAESEDGEVFRNYRFWMWPDERTPESVYAADLRCHESIYVSFWNPYGRDKVQIQAAVSRDGFHWERPSMEPLVPVAEGKEAWDSGNIQSSGGCFVEVGDEFWIYYSGGPGGHGRRWGGSDGRPSYCATGLARMRLDGFFSMDGGADEGMLTTRPLEFSGGKLFVNVDAPKGELRVEVLDEGGKALPGFSRDECNVITSDSVKTQVTWKRAESMQGLAGKPIRLRFCLRNGSLYSFAMTP